MKWGTIVRVSVTVALVPHPKLDVPVTVTLKTVVVVTFDKLTFSNKELKLYSNMLDVGSISKY